MPDRPPRPCTAPSCPALVAWPRSRCPAHESARRAHHDAARRGDPHGAFLRRAAWLRLRAAHIADHPLCARCSTDDRPVVAHDVDHIIDRRDGGAELDPLNLQSLCRSCHARKTRTAMNERLRTIAQDRR